MHPRRGSVPGVCIRRYKEFALATGRSTKSTLLRVRDKFEIFETARARARRMLKFRLRCEKCNDRIRLGVASLI